ncbi:Tfp pilus assembly protein FimT/FimU [Sphingomonas sp.]|uniref:pilus assembly FimT family protein n=1 Tax=Sphingomonas sp. TaxID=28214 RepID=UPI0035C7B0E4
MSAAGRPSGFTLIEMLVVLAVTALIAGLSFPAIERSLRGQAFESAADATEFGLRQARADAIRSGQPTRFALGPDRRSIVREGGRPIELPAAIAIALPTQGITFFGDGTATGGTVALTGSGRERRLAVDPGSGAVALVR